MRYAIRPSTVNSGVLLRFVDADPPIWWPEQMPCDGCFTTDKALADKTAAQHDGTVATLEDR